jgi:hypothetical protein
VRGGDGFEFSISLVRNASLSLYTGVGGYSPGGGSGCEGVPYRPLQSE